MAGKVSSTQHRDHHDDIRPQRRGLPMVIQRRLYREAKLTEVPMTSRPARLTGQNHFLTIL